MGSYHFIQQAIMIERNFSELFPNDTIASYYMGLRTNQANFYSKVIEECFDIKYYDTSYPVSQINRPELNLTMLFKHWCQKASNIWFGDIYWRLWRQSREQYIITQLIDPIVKPIINFINFFLLLFSLPVFVHLDKGQNKALWCFLYWYMVFRILRFLVEVFPDMICGRLFNCERNVKSYSGLCRVLTFSSHVMHYTADWINISLLLDHIVTLKARRRNEGISSGRSHQRYQTVGRGLSRFGSKLVVVFVIIGLVVVNAHTLWLYSSKKNKTCALDSEGQPFIFITGYPYLLHIVHRLIPNILCICGVIGLYISACKSGRCCADTRIAIFFGLLYLIFNIPSTIQFIYLHYLRFSDVANTFPFFKLNYIMNTLVKLWSEFRDVISVLLLFAFSCLFRRGFKNVYTWFFSVLCDSIYVWRTFYNDNSQCECYCMKLRCVKANSADLYQDEIEENGSNRRDSTFNDSIPPFWTICACWRTEAWIEDTRNPVPNKKRFYKAIIPIDFDCYWLEEAKKVTEDKKTNRAAKKNATRNDDEFEHIECISRSTNERRTISTNREISN